MQQDNKTLRAALQAANDLQAFHDWLRSDADRLIGAAELLGGDDWKDRATTLCAVIADGADLFDLEHDTRQLHRLLTLEFADDVGSVEAIRFMRVHPDDPRADDARLCAEALESGLDAISIMAAAGIREAA